MKFRIIEKRHLLFRGVDYLNISPEYNNYYRKLAYYLQEFIDHIIKTPNWSIEDKAGVLGDKLQSYPLFIDQLPPLKPGMGFKDSLKKEHRKKFLTYLHDLYIYFRKYAVDELKKLKNK